MNVPPAYDEPDNNRYNEAAPPYNEADEDYVYTFEKPEKPIPAPDYDEAFPISTPKYNDTFFTYLFLAVLSAFGILVYKNYSPQSIPIWSTDVSTEISKPMKQLYALIGISTITPFLTSTIALLLVYTAPTFFLIVAFSLVPISLAAMTFSAFASGSIVLGSFFALMAFGSFMFMITSYNRFAFSATILKLVVKAVSTHPSTLFVSFLSAIISAVIAIAYILAITMIANSRFAIDDSYCPHTNGNDICVSNTTVLIAIFSLFTGFYVFQVIENTTHVILAGIFSSWYFFDISDTKPLNAASGAVKRAFTYCFGSICFGSLIVSVVQTTKVTLQTLKAKLRAGSYRNGSDSDSANQLLLCVLLCIVTIFEWFATELEYWIRWFNRYAYSYLAMYGKPYLQSARDTFEILRYKGLDILINDSLISSAINFYSLLSVVLTGIALYVSFHTLDMSPEMLVIGASASLLVSWFITSIAINVLDVGCVTLMVALSVDPTAFVNPASIERIQAWEQMQRYYPGLTERVMLDWPDNIN
ncbi:hypothetical protein CANINC_001533 [Pichia inconspicua]|uniref:Protein PNS1 n=1 Tax=Pichia inconspicua TaxID=52247 RepID=A0A4T0X538_9ASCO|nr:hypothetical protein CANINC_001533 [[Candida] inconspicua]